MDTDGQVYLGPWTNWSRGSVMGATLTLTREQGNLLIAFTALFVPFVASRFWRVFAILFHQCYSRSDPRDAIHHQRQVVLRNSSSPESGLFSFIRLLWAWRRTTTPNRPWLRVLPVALFSSFSICAFTVAGGFSSMISTAGEVLLRGDDCEIATTADANPLLYVYQCAPLATEERTRDITVSNQTFTTYNYGSMASKDPKQANYTYAVPGINTQYTRPDAGIFKNNNFLLSSMAFHLDQGSVMLNDSAFNPDPAIVRQDGDVTLIFLSGNGLIFVPQADDDWYRATVPNGNISGIHNGQMLGMYRPEEAASPLGCVEQYQWCRDPLRGQCGNLEGIMDALYSAAVWFNLTSKDLEPDRPVIPTKLGSLLIWSFYNTWQAGSALEGLISTLGPSSLASHSMVRQGSVGSLAKNQWQLDVTRWWTILLARFQASYVSTARGRTNSAVSLDDTIRPANEYEWSTCRNQKIRSAQYTSFSVFGLVFTYSMGALIIILSFTIAPILNYLQKRGRYNRYAYLEWQGHTAIQLHRVGQEQFGYGNWVHCDERIPITQPSDTMLAPFDISDPKHPLLARTSNDSSVDETKPETIVQDSSSTEQPLQQESLEHSGDNSRENSTTGVRRAATDAHAHVRRDYNTYTMNEDLDGYQRRPTTAP
ncbi:hypothetical protein PG999_010284 [Apiospora kogelbergensis]|uniref:Uncharacterized protein n=1 Tax=Apiospora kogelbergensis TaxID=1337665 RepID=A0AAW0Q9M8_9PEZI